MMARSPDPRRPANASRAYASVAAALACAAAADTGAVLVNKLLTDGAVVAAACAVGQLAVWAARALRRVVRAAVAA
jgi:hypothetical protein